MVKQRCNIPFDKLYSTVYVLKFILFLSCHFFVHSLSVEFF